MHIYRISSLSPACHKHQRLRRRVLLLQQVQMVTPPPRMQHYPVPRVVWQEQEQQRQLPRPLAAPMTMHTSCNIWATSLANIPQARKVPFSFILIAYCIRPTWDVMTMSMPQSYPTRICNASRIILYIVQLSNASVLYIEHLYSILVYIVIVLMMFTQLSC